MNKDTKNAVDATASLSGRSFALWLIVITTVAGFFRLYDLGASALRGDTIHFWSIFNQGLSAGQIWENWMKLGVSAQFPFPMVISKGLADLLGLPVSFTSIRLGSALMGILAVVAMAGLGNALFNKRFGLFLACILALNPFHIQVSREAYFYAAMITGAVLLAWALVAVWKLCLTNSPPSRKWYFLYAAGFFVLTYSQVTGWIMGGLCVAVLAGCMIYAALKHSRSWWSTLLKTGGITVVLGLPLLFYPWALPWMLKTSSGAAKARAQQALDVSSESVFSMIQRVLTGFSWGNMWWGWLLVLAALAAGLFYCIKQIRKRPETGALPFILTTGFLLFLLSRQQKAALFEPRYFAAFLPFYLALLSLGIWSIGNYLRNLLKHRSFRTGQAVQAGCLILGLLPLVYPAWLTTRLEGKPAPYKEIVSWCDNNLSPGTPIIVDRWFEPWNELAAHPASNVTFTFTIPNEPVDMFIKHNWRQTVQSFMQRFPEAGYLEITKQYEHVAEVGPWAWPEIYFRQKQTFTNEAGLKLRHMGLASRGDFYADNSNRVVVTLFYNTLQDVLDIKQSSHEPFALWYEDGWSFNKTQDYRSWRVMRQRATVDIYNLTEQPRSVQIILRGTAAGGRKTVAVPNATSRIFQNGQLVDWVIGTIELQPGRNRLQLIDPQYQNNQIPLLVEYLKVQP